MAGHITIEQANQFLREMVEALVAAFNAQQRSIETPNAETRSHIDQTRADVDRSLIDNKATAEAYVVQQVGALRAQTVTSVNHVDSKVEEMRNLLLHHDKTQGESAEESKRLIAQLEEFASGVQASI